MNPEQAISRDPYVAEKWWHRLLRVLMYVSTLAVLAFSGVVLIDNSSSYTYSYTYSFERNYEQAEGEEHTCFYHEKLGLGSCGELKDLVAFLARYEAAYEYEADKETPSQQSDPKPWEKYRSTNDSAHHWEDDPVVGEYDPRQLAATKAAMQELRGEKIRYRQATHWNAGPLIRSVGLTLGIATLWYVFTFIIYKVTLFIAYGHTRVRKGLV